MAKNEPAPAPTSQQLLAEINTKIRDLREKDKGLLSEQLVFERAGVRPEEPKAGPDARHLAANLLNGFAPAANREPSDANKLHALLVERDAIRIAVDVLEQKETQTRILAHGKIMKETGADWRAITRERVEAILALHRANVKAGNFRARLWKATHMNPNLICDPQGHEFGTSISGTLYLFMQAALAAGIVSRKEIVAAGEVKK